MPVFYSPGLHHSQRHALGIIGNTSLSIEITEDHQYDLMHICTACVASSGTATLETALMELPTVLVYRLAPVTWFLANLLVHVKYAGLPNLLLNREVTPELLQDRANAETSCPSSFPGWKMKRKGKRM